MFPTVFPIPPSLPGKHKGRASAADCSYAGSPQNDPETADLITLLCLFRPLWISLQHLSPGGPLVRLDAPQYPETCEI